MKPRILFCSAIWMAAAVLAATPEEARTARLHDAKWGVFNHFLGHGCKTPEEWNRKVEALDVEKIADQLESCGARFYFITLMQGGKFMCAPNATYDRIAGTKPGEACSRRDLPMELAAALEKRGIDLYLYFTGDGPYKDETIGRRFGFTEPRRAGVTRPFVEKWASVLGEYAVRYGDRVKGWWIDGCYKDFFKYDDDLLALYAAAARGGNPDALVSMNNGVKPYYEKHYSREDFTAGEFNDFFVIPRTRFVRGAQTFLLAPLGVSRNGSEWGAWSQGGCKRDAAYMADFVSLVNRNGGVVAIDVKVNGDGSFQPEQLAVLKAVGERTDHTPRTLHMTDFTRPFGTVTLGGEFPGAKGEVSLRKERGRRFARLSFDLTKGNYVGYAIDEVLPKVTTRMSFTVRTETAGRARLFFRLNDNEKQTHLQRMPFAPTGEWTTVSFALDVKASHWGGANDGVVRLPAKQCVLGIEVDGTNRVGALDIADVAVETTAAERDLPSATVICTASRFGALYHPEESPSFSFTLRRRDLPPGAVCPPARFFCRVEDAKGERLCSRLLAPGESTLALSPADLGNRFGALKLTVGAGRTARTSIWFARLTGPAPKPCPWVGTGLHGGHGWGRGDLRFLDLLTEAGIGVVRDEPGWANCECAKGVYQVPPRVEELVKGLNARGIGFNLILDYANGVYENPLDPDAFANWSAFMVRHFGSRVRTWEIWNEPQNFHFRKHYGGEGTNAVWITKFVELTRKADAAIRAVAPDADVAVTAEDVEPLLMRMLDLGIAGKRNLVSFHPYCHGQPRPEREMWFRDGGRALRARAAANGGASRFCITEAGWTTYSGKMKYLEIAGGYPRSSYLQQAGYLVRMYILTRQTGLDYACQYDFMDDGGDRSYTEHNFGLVHQDCSPKPSFAAVAFMTRLLGAAEPRGDLSADPAVARLCRFTTATGEVLAAWSVEGDRPVALPNGWERARCFDLQGNPIPLPVKDGLLRLSEEPLYLMTARSR